MKRIVLSTSSSSLNYLNVPHNVRFVPFHLTTNNVDFLDNKNLTTATLSKIMMDIPSTVTTTSPATEEELNILFNELYESGYAEVFVCTISSKISKSYEIFCKMQEKFANRMNVYVYDTKTLNIDEGVLAFEADCMIQEGVPMPDIAKYLDKLRKNTLFMFTLDDLRFIVRNKKLSAPAGFIANLFDIKPIMWVDGEGAIFPLQKVRKLERTLRQMADNIVSAIDGQEAFIYVVDATIDVCTTHFLEILATEYGITNVPVIPVSTVSLANHGPTGVGIGAYYGTLPRLVEYFR